MSTQVYSAKRELALIEETELSIRLIRMGFGLLQRISPSNDFYHAPILLISNGVERFLKCTYCVIHYHNTGQFPSVRDLKKIGHDLLSVLGNEILSFMGSSGIRNLQAINDDYNFVTHDPVLNRLISLLSAYGKGGRYHNLDIISGASHPALDIESEWKGLEMDIALSDMELSEMLKDPSRSKELFMRINIQIISLLERFIRALSRYYTLGGLGQLSASCSVFLNDFLFLTDSNLGKIDYISSIA